MPYFRWDKPFNDHVMMTIQPRDWVNNTPSLNATGDWETVLETQDQNYLRHAMATLHRCQFPKGYPSYGSIWDLMVTFDGKSYRLWSYSRNWPGRGMFLAGILEGRKNRWRRLTFKRLRKNRRKATRQD